MTKPIVKLMPDLTCIELSCEPIRCKPFIGMDLADCEPPLRFRPKRLPFWRRAWARLFGRGGAMVRKEAENKEERDCFSCGSSDLYEDVEPCKTCCEKADHDNGDDGKYFTQWTPKQ